MGGPGRDPYLAGGMGSSLPAAHRRAAAGIYWNIRNSSVNVRAYLSNYYPGNREDAVYRELWMAGEIIDSEIDGVYRQGGMPALTFFLDSSDTMEHLLNRIASEVAYHRTGDLVMS